MNELEQLEKFNARKASKPVVVNEAAYEDPMEFETVLEENEQDA